MYENILPEEWSDWAIPEDENGEDSELGEGSYGVVYKAEKHTGPITAVSAVKVIRIPQKDSYMKDLLSSAGSEKAVTGLLREMVEQFASEIATMYSLQGNSHIVSIQDHIIRESEDHRSWKIYIRMEYLTPFTEYNTTNKLGETDVLQLGMDICDALVKCSKRNILHRDVKPENIFVTEDRDFKLGDFGVSRLADCQNGQMSAKGTSMYMAPEMVRMNPYDSRADQYSLGIVLYRLMNDYRFPFVDQNQKVVGYRVQNEALERRMKGETLPAPVNASKAFAEVILKACAFNPEDRYPNSQAFYEALKEVAEGKVFVEAAGEGGENNGVKEAKKESPVSRYAKAIGITAAICCAIAGGVYLKNANSPETNESTTTAQLILQSETTVSETAAAQSEPQSEVQTETKEPEEAATATFHSELFPYLPSFDESELNLKLTKNTKLPVRRIAEVGKTSEGTLISVIDYSSTETVAEDVKDGSTVAYQAKLILATKEGDTLTLIGDTDDEEETKAVQAAVTELNLSKIAPKGYAQAVEDGRYVLDFEPDNYMYLNKDAVFASKKMKQAELLWADENGEVFLSVWLGNGSKETWIVNRIKGTVLSGDEEIAAFSATGGAIIPAGNGTMVTFSLGEIENDLPEDSNEIKVVFD